MARTVEKKFSRKPWVITPPESRPDDGPGAISDDATVFLDVPGPYTMYRSEERRVGSQ